MPTLPTTPPRPTIRSITCRASRSIALACLLGSAALAAQAQLFGDKNDWKEDKAAEPPAFKADKLLTIDVPSYSSLKFGVDPETIRITTDGVVSYVVVATSRDGNAVNAFFEGMHCATEEVKTYARFTNGAWEPVKEPLWKHMDAVKSSYARALFNQGMCREHAPWNSVKATVSKLRTPVRNLE